MLLVSKNRVAEYEYRIKLKPIFLNTNNSIKLHKKYCKIKLSEK